MADSENGEVIHAWFEIVTCLEAFAQWLERFVADLDGRAATLADQMMMRSRSHEFELPNAPAEIGFGYESEFDEEI